MKTVYVCNLCAGEYAEEARALECETVHRQIINAALVGLLMPEPHYMGEEVDRLLSRGNPFTGGPQEVPVRVRLAFSDNASGYDWAEYILRGFSATNLARKPTYLLDSMEDMRSFCPPDGLAIRTVPSREELKARQLETALDLWQGVLQEAVKRGLQADTATSWSDTLRGFLLGLGFTWEEQEAIRGTFPQHP